MSILTRTIFCSAQTTKLKMFRRGLSCRFCVAKRHKNEISRCLFVTQHVTTFYVQKEQYQKDIESSRGSLEDCRSFSFIELYILVFYVHEHVTTPRQFTPAQNQTTSQQQNNKTQKPSHHNNKQQNAKTITRAPIQWRT